MPWSQRGAGVCLRGSVIHCNDSVTTTRLREGMLQRARASVVRCDEAGSAEAVQIELTTLLRAARAAPRKETSPAGSTWAVSISQGFGIQARGIGITMPIVLAGITMPIVLRVGIPKP